MSRTLVLYEVSEKEDLMDDFLTRKGYFDRYFCNNQAYILPCRVRWKADQEPDAVVAELQLLAKELNITLKNVIALPSWSWSGIIHQTMDAP